MSRLNTAVHNDLKLLELLRDELFLQAHLMKAETHDKWVELEKKWGDLKDHIARAAVAGDAAQKEARTAAQLMTETLHSGYSSIRDAIKH